MTTKLFRPEVLEGQQEDWLGSVRLVKIKMGWPIALALAALAVVVLVLLVFGRYTRSENVGGHLVPSQGLLTVTALSSGTLTQLYVNEGQSVRQGQPLLEISAERDSTAVGEVGAAVAAELKSQHARLGQELDELEEVAEREEAQLQRRLKTLNRQLHLSEAQLNIRQRQMIGAQTLLERIQPVRSSGQITALQLQQYESQALEAEAQYELARLQRVITEQERADTENELEELPARMAVRRNELERLLAEVFQAIARNEGERSIIIRAPRAGVISGLNVAGGQSVSTGQILLAIVPEGSELHAELWVPANAIGRIETGGRVIMRYHAYPYQQFGQQHGRIAEIAHRALSPKEIRQSSGMEVDAPAYRVRVVPEQQVIHAEGRMYLLRANATLDAALVLDRRRLIEMLGFPLRVGKPTNPEVPVSLTKGDNL